MAKKIFIGFISILIITVVSAFLWFNPKLQSYQELATEKLFSINQMTFKSKIDTQILDMNGEKIGEIVNNRYIPIEIGDAPSYLKKGYIAIEDKSFLEHNGYDSKAILRAAIAYIKNNRTITQGGSTITQQVLKNNLLTEIEDKWDRKILEILLAPKVEQRMSKDQILEAYMNTNYYGNRCYGIGSASRFYFGKLTQDLTIEESAMLIGLSNSPTRYDPVKNYSDSMAKVKRVLDTMLEDGVITQSEYDTAVSKEIEIKQDRQGRTKESYPVSLAIHDATLRLMEQDGFEFEYVFKSPEMESLYRDRYKDSYSKTSEYIRTGGLYIYTSIDQEIQKKAEQALEKELKPYTERTSDNRFTLQASTTVVENSTGMIKAVVGGRGADEEYNRAFLSQRQPGSAIKPIAVYTPAFESGKYYPSLVLEDKFDKDTKGAPKNYGEIYYGNINIRKALSVSANTIPFRIIQKEGMQLALTPLEKLKFTGLTSIDSTNSSLSVGGFTKGVTTQDMAKAYSTLANNGQYINRRLVTKILTQDQKLLLSPTNVEVTDVFTPDSAWLMLDTLKGVVDEGTGTLAKIPGVALSGKTGTTNEDKDSWFCGATTDYAIATWVGYDMPKPLPYNVVSGSAMRISKEIMKPLHPNGSKQFERPATVEKKTINPATGVPTDRNTGKTDYFSIQVLDMLKAQREEEKKIELDEKIEDLESQISEFRDFTVTETKDIITIDTLYSNLINKINSIGDSDKQQELLDSLKDTYEYLNAIHQSTRMDYDREVQERIELENQRAEEQRLAKEQQAIREQEENKREQKELETYENLFMEAMENLRNYRYSEEPVSVLLIDAQNKLANCADSKYYGVWTAELREIENEIELE